MKEFDLINRYFTDCGAPSDRIILGVGDDAAVLRMPGTQECQLISVDTLVSGRHFHADDPPESVAHKALMVNLSDINAMGGRSIGVLLALSLPELDETWLAAFSRTFHQQASRCGVSLMGGDTTQGPLTVSVTALGIASSQEGVLKRSQAQTGDGIYITGNLGAAGYYLYARANQWSWKASAQQAYEYPEPPLRLGPLLSGIAHAAIDISDGFLADLNHILHASHVGAELSTQAFPIYAEWEQAVANGKLTADQAFYSALSCGDDYQLCFTVPKENEHLISQLAAETQIPIVRVGTIQNTPGIFFDGKAFELPLGGWQHFAAISYKLVR